MGGVMWPSGHGAGPEGRGFGGASGFMTAVTWLPLL